MHYNEGLYVGYRHFDARNVEPQFPFGFGLSYTEFQYRDLEITETGTGEAFALEVSFKVKNTGSCDGAEVAQLYVSDVLSSVDRPAKELKGFKKVFLKRGEEKTVTLRLGCDALSFYDPTQKRWVAEAGDFEILVGSSSRDIRLKGLHMFLV